MSAKQRFMIIDGNALLHRAFHALPPLSTKDGKLVNAVYGFTTVLMKALKELKPAYAAVTFDLPGPTFRDELYKEYKAQRVKQPQELYDQLPMVKEVVRAFGIPVVEKEGVEADDVIATLVKETRKHGNMETENIIVTGDLDTLQLVDEHTKVYSFRKGVSDIVIYDEKAVGERFGLKPEQMVDYKALRGDPSDNIPGVRGIGEKTAAELLQEFGSLEEVYRHLDGISERVATLLKIYKDDALLGKKLVELRRDVPIQVSLKDCKIPAPNTGNLREVFEKYEFKNLIARLDEGEKKEQGSLLGGASEANNAAQAFRPDVRSFDKLRTGSKDLSFIVVQAKEGTWGHDLKSLFKQYQYPISNIQYPLFDTMIASYLLHPGSRTHDFESVVKEHLGAAPSPQSSPTQGEGRVREILQQLVTILKDELAKEKLTFVFEKIEMPLIPVLFGMEQAGIKLDTAYLKKLSKEFSAELEKLTKKIYKHAGGEFNINSPVQLREILYDKLKLAPEAGRIRKTVKGGVASTAAGELEKLRGAHPIVDFIFEYRELAKLKSTYTDALVELVDPKDGRVHTTFNQAVTATGRLSSSNPNLQNIPIKTETGRQIRKAFIAEKGYVLLSADYSQIELRVAASLSGDPEMIKAFKSGRDFHTETAVRVFGVTPEKVTKEMRRNAKAINFGIIYGMGATSLAQSTGMARSEAQQYIDRYFEVYNGLYAFLEGFKQHARDKGYVATLFGRRRYLPEITSGVQQVRAAAERMAINMPIQGTAADLIKMAMIRLYEQIAHEYTTNSSQIREPFVSDSRAVHLLLQVHDELVFEVNESLIAEVAPKIKSIMESVHELKVPIKVELKQGNNWGELEKFTPS